MIVCQACGATPFADGLNRVYLVRRWGPRDLEQLGKLRRQIRMPTAPTTSEMPGKPAPIAALVAVAAAARRAASIRAIALGLQAVDVFAIARDAA